MKDKMLEESLNNFYRTFLIWVIRCYPIYCSVLLYLSISVRLYTLLAQGILLSIMMVTHWSIFSMPLRFRTNTLPYSLTPNCLMQYCSMCCQRYFYFVYTIEYLSLKCLYTQYWILYLIMWCLRMHI